jgi:enediyne biosynthesis protein E3
MEGSIAQRVEQIVATFKAAREVAEREGRSAMLSEHLAHASEYCRSVAFEGAAMGLALRDFSQWENLLTHEGVTHAVQVHIGLGWALAEQQRPLPENPTWPDSDSVADGYGYYHGLFRRRLTIRTQGMPDGLSEAELPAFDRGVGRSMWYICKGDVEQLRTMVTAFPGSRHPALWLGVGIAVAFVGGCSDAQLEEVAQASSIHRATLLEGAQRALASRTFAGTPTQDAERTVSVWG